MEYFGDIVYVNGEYVSPSVIPKYDSKNIYEVIRIINGKILFWEEHFERLNTSLLAFKAVDSIDKINFESVITQLVLKNKTENINVRINIYLGNTLNTIIGLIPSVYPPLELYKGGVKTILFNAVRDNPEVKVVHPNLQKEIIRLKAHNGVYEVLLVNHNNCITEGSRSNVFFIKNKCVYTAPTKDVLNGITRMKVISVCRALGILVKEEPIPVDKLSSFDACFMSGTSPKVLPICAIDFHVYQTDDAILQTIMNEYNNLINSVLY